MRPRRYKVEGEVAVYHCISRTVNGEFLLGEKQQEVMRRQLWQLADFSGVEVLTYCILSNHIHVLVRVPLKPEALCDVELIRRYRCLYPKDTEDTRKRCGAVMGREPAARIERILAAGGCDAELLRKSLLKRMHDVSEFMKTLKQRFSVWYNHNYNRFGTLWSDRFKSVIVENDPHSLANVAAYIDLNAVRAGLVSDPKDFRFCGYAEALGGQNKLIRKSLCSVVGRDSWTKAQRDYRMILFGKGTTAKADTIAAGTIPWDQAKKVLKEGGRLPISTALRCRIRYFTDGAVLGSEAYVAAAQRMFCSKKENETKVRVPVQIPGADWQGLCVMRRLRLNPFGPD
jgi:putative transposase